MLGGPTHGLPTLGQQQGDMEHPSLSETGGLSPPPGSDHDQSPDKDRNSLVGQELDDELEMSRLVMFFIVDFIHVSRG